jgi:plasmid stability protein
MAALHLPNLDEELARHLDQRAARTGRSPEEETRDILQEVLVPASRPAGPGLATSIRAKFAPFGPFEIDLPPRDRSRELPRFD